MIKTEDIFAVGKIIKPHGVFGEMSFSFTTDVFDAENADYFILDMDGIFVPFYIESYRFRTDTTGLLKLDGIQTDEQAKELAGLTLYLPNKFQDNIEEENITLDFFIGFNIIDNQLGKIGEIISIDDSTENVLFEVKEGEKEILIPANDDFITDIDYQHKTIHTNLPEGILEL